MTTYSDEYLEHWGRIFEQRDLYCRFGIRFDTFLIWPEDTLAAVDALIAEHGPELRPLLPAQAQVMHAQAEAERLEQGMLPHHARLRERGYVEPMRHHAYASAHRGGIGSRAR